MQAYPIGQVVLVANMVDLAGRNPKDRPEVIVVEHETHPVVVAISTLRPGSPLPDDCIRVPWHAQGHPRTGLNTNCAAVCFWSERVAVSRIRPIGMMPGQTIERITHKLDEMTD